MALLIPTNHRQRPTGRKGRTGFRSFLLRVDAVIILLLASSLGGQAQTANNPDLTQVSLEDLMNIRVTSVSKKEQRLLKTPAAVFVITQEDIHRSGATNIPDLLRMVPGVDVARITANTWAISIRGFNTRYSDKVLVLIDGRNVYTPSFSGVYWDQQDVPLEDIDRIEVIRGPGGTVWGQNAMNGVINIITKSARATEGGLISAGAGSELNADGLAQYGGKIGQSGAYRVFGKYFDVNNSSLPNGSRAADGWHGLHGGFRADWDLSPRDALTVEGDLYQTGEGQTLTSVISNDLPNIRTFNDRVTVGSGDLLGRWDHTLSNGSEMQLQIYYDHFDRVDQAIDETLDTFDVDFQHHLAIGSRHDIVWGLGYRRTSDKLTPGYDALFLPPHRSDNLYSSFVQDEIRLTDSLWLTVGTKFGHNAYSGFEFQPGAQLSWMLSGRQSIWLSTSRPIRVPSLQDFAIRYDAAVVPLDSGFGVVKIVGTPQTNAEVMLDFEGGYRAQLSKKLSLDLAIFRSLYDSLETAEPAAPFFVDHPAPPHLVFPQILKNMGYARSYGGEVSASWNVTRRWRISPGYSIMHLDVISDQESQDSTAQAVEGDSPKHQFQFRSLLNLNHNLDWDSSLYYVGALRGGSFPGYTRLDSRLGWRIGESLELSLVGQNLLTPRHFEFANAFEVNHTSVPRSVVGRITWRF